MVGALPETLPTSNQHIMTSVGDVVLYNGNQLVIFYGQNTWSYTRLGKIEHVTSSDIRDFFGSDEAIVELTVGQ